MRSAILLLKKPVAWLVGGAKWGNTRVHGPAWSSSHWGEVNIFEGRTFSGPEWTDLGGGRYQVTSATTGVTLSVDGGIDAILGDDYEFVLDIESISGSGIIPQLAGGNGSLLAASGTDISDTMSSLQGGSGIVAGFLAATGTSVIISNLRLYHRG